MGRMPLREGRFFPPEEGVFGFGHRHRITCFSQYWFSLRGRRFGNEGFIRHILCKFQSMCKIQRRLLCDNVEWV